MTLPVKIPRPILKHPKTPPPSPLSASVQPDQQPLDHHTVHFPPSPCITRTFEMYSASIYDRSPIVIGPNACALPARGCPGRTYYKVGDDEEDELSLCTRFLQLAESRESKRDHAHPRVLEREVNKGPANDHPLPLLIPDLTTSESEESDGFISPPPEKTSLVSFARNDSSITALFPPEPPSHPSLLSSFSLEQSLTYQVEALAKPRPVPSRPRGRRSRSSSSSPTHRDDDPEEDPGYVEDNEQAATTPTRSSVSPPRLSSSPPSPGNTRKRGCKKVDALRQQLCKSLSFHSDRTFEDDGCLGGF